MAAPKPTTVRIMSSQTHPILETVDTFQPRLRQEGITNATVTRIAFLTGSIPVTVETRKGHQDDHDDGHDEGEDDDDDDDDDDAYIYICMHTHTHTSE